MLYAHPPDVHPIPGLIPICSVDPVVCNRGWRLYDVRFNDRNEFFRADCHEDLLV